VIKLLGKLGVSYKIPLAVLEKNLGILELTRGDVVC